MLYVSGLHSTMMLAVFSVFCVTMSGVAAAPTDGTSLRHGGSPPPAPISVCSANLTGISINVGESWNVTCPRDKLVAWDSFVHVDDASAGALSLCIATSKKTCNDPNFDADKDCSVVLPFGRAKDYMGSTATANIAGYVGDDTCVIVSCVYPYGWDPCFVDVAYNLQAKSLPSDDASANTVTEH